jgi:sugar lactone lactonase YvrE
MDMGSRNSRVLAAVIAGVAVAACATAAPGLRFSLVRGPGQPEAGRAVSVVVRASRRAHIAVWIARGRTHRSFAARPLGAGRYRARVVFPAAGRWRFGAQSGKTRVALGLVRVRRSLMFVWPTSIDVVSNRSLLLVENGTGRVLRIDPVTGKTAVVTTVDRAYAVAHAPSGAVYLAAGRRILRLEAGQATPIVEADGDIGPITVAADGDVFYATTTQAFRLVGGTGAPQPVAAQLAGPHGLAATGDGGLLVCDTGAGRVKRIDLGTGAVETWANLDEPRGIDIAADGTVYIVDASTHRVVHLMIDGRRLGTVKRAFADPYDVEAADDGSLYVIDTSASGSVYRVAPNGTTTAISRR